ncbi:UbiD family decarboxylase [Acidobacteria bacterium AH-259-D05]|nr:UbiD family decarboxylase [Acidobacteria bacterium AH-259-D05]
MSNNDLRDYLESLESHNQLLKVPSEIDTLDEMGAFIARSDYEGIDRAILFEKPKGFQIPVLANTVGSTHRRIATTFGVALERSVPEVAQKMGKIMASGGISPVYVNESKAPCKEVVLRGEEADLSLIPILRLNPGDGSGGPAFTEGRFISSLACSKPSESSHNLSYHRFEIQGPRHGAVWIFRQTNDAQGISEAWGAKPEDPPSTWDKSKGEPYPMAYVLGVTPEFLLTGANPGLPYKYDDFAFVGGLLGRPVEMVKCETIDLDVPANAEIVVEGIFKPFNWGTQGRFASFNGYYDEPRTRPIFDVTAITMRKRPIYQHVHIGLPLNECNNIAAFFRSVKVYRDLREVLPNVRDVFVDPAAGCGFTVHIALKKTRIGEPKMAMMRAYTALQGFAKHVFVYDEDVDIRSPHERDWALAHRFMADRDLTVIPNVMGMVIDPLAQGNIGTPSRLGVYEGYPEIPLNTRPFMGVDCTLPLNLKVFEQVNRQPEVESRIDSMWNAANREGRG